MQGLAHGVQLDGAGRARCRRPHHGDAELVARSRRPALRDRIAPLRYSGRQRAPPDRRPRTGRRSRPRRGVRTAGRAPAALGRNSWRPKPTRSCCARTSPPPERSSPTTGRAPSTCSVSPANSCSTRSTTGACATGSTPATSSWRSARPAPTTAGWPSSARSTTVCCRPLRARCADIERAPAMADRGDRHGRRRAAHRVGLPARALAEPRRARRRVGRGAEAGVPIVFHVGGTGDLIDPSYFPTGCRSRPTSTAARRTSAPSTTWASPPRRPRRWPR